MISIYIKDAQAIKEYIFELPDHGLIQFVGDNSNGKSVLGKIIAYSILQRLDNDDQRLPMINDDAESALLAMEYNGKRLIVNIDRDLEKSFYQLIRPDGTKVLRRIKDDGIDELLREFGFLIYNKRSLALQVCETYGPMPFVNRTDVEDAELVTSVISDPTAERFLDNYAMCFKEAKEMKKSYENELNRYQTQLDNIQIKETTGFLELSERLKRCYDINEIMKSVEEIDMPYVPSVSFDMPQAKLIEDMYVPYLITEEATQITGFDSMLNELWKIERGVCPTCGKKFLSEECTD